MSTPESVLAQTQELIDMANAATGRTDTNLTDAVEALIAGYGLGGVCTHDEQETVYTIGTDGSHTYETRCKVCDQVVGSDTEPCADADGDSLCDKCGAAMPSEPVCSHSTVDKTYSTNNDGTHNVIRTCTECGEIVAVTLGGCSEDIPTVTANEDGTHTSVTKCRRCGYVMSQTTADCADEDADGKCDVCGWAFPTQPEEDEEDDNAVWDYIGADDDLKGRSNYRFYVSGADGTLGVISADGYVALGAKSSGTTPQAIPVPKSSTKVTLTFNNTWTTSVKLLFFSGTPTSATDVVEYTVDVVNGVAALSASGSDYVVVNCMGSSSSATAQAQVASNAALIFGRGEQT